SEYCINLKCDKCVDDGLVCLMNSDCCSGYCVNFMCGPCTQDGEWCALNSDCCSALCVYFECGPCREYIKFRHNAGNDRKHVMSPEFAAK
ncbi:unnamed protein product, partial [Allacma fusca]